MSATPPLPGTGEASPDLGFFRRTFQAFHYANFRLMWGGAFTSTTGAFVQEVAQSWLVYQLTNDPFLLGLTVFLNNGPILLLSLFGGVAADRMDRRMLLIGSQLVQMSAALTLAALIWTDHIQIWHILGAAFFTGLGQAFGGPAYQALIPSLVDKHVLPNAIALMSIQFNLAGVVGRAIGGVAFEALGAGWCFAINGLSFLAVIVSLLLLPSKFTPAKHQSHVLLSLREGLSFVYCHQTMLPLVVLGVATAFLGVPVMTLLPVFAKDVYMLGPKGYSYLAAIFGAGGVIGALTVAWLGDRGRKGRRTLIMQIALGLAALGFGLVSNVWVAGGFLLCLGASVLFVFASITSLVQLLAPENMRGRVMSVFNTAFRGSMALGPPVAGYLSRTLGAPIVVAVNGAFLIAVAVGFLLRSKRIRSL
ncbi:MAG: MFS transporter [Bryobacterales bacterium]|nr:MFS transporter [Bryobacterales bacterium]